MTDLIMHNTHAKSLQLCLTLCDPKDCSLPDSSAHGILQARILKWVAVHSSRGAFWGRDRSLCLLPALADRFFTTRATWKASGSSSVSSQTWVYNQLFWGRVWNTNLWLMGVCIRHLGKIYQQKMIPPPRFSPSLSCVSFWKKICSMPGNRCLPPLIRRRKTISPKWNDAFAAINSPPGIIRCRHFHKRPVSSDTPAKNCSTFLTFWSLAFYGLPILRSSCFRVICVVIALKFQRALNFYTSLNWIIWEMLGIKKQQQEIDLYLFHCPAM